MDYKKCDLKNTEGMAGEANKRQREFCKNGWVLFAVDLGLDFMDISKTYPIVSKKRSPIFRGFILSIVLLVV